MADSNTPQRYIRTHALETPANRNWAINAAFGMDIQSAGPIPIKFADTDGKLELQNNENKVLASIAMPKGPKGPESLRYDITSENINFTCDSTRNTVLGESTKYIGINVYYDGKKLTYNETTGGNDNRSFNINGPYFASTVTATVYKQSQLSSIVPALFNNYSVVIAIKYIPGSGCNDIIGQYGIKFNNVTTSRPISVAFVPEGKRGKGIAKIEQAIDNNASGARIPINFYYEGNNAVAAEYNVDDLFAEGEQPVPAAASQPDATVYVYNGKDGDSYYIDVQQLTVPLKAANYNVAVNAYINGVKQKLSASPSSKYYISNVDKSNHPEITNNNIRIYGWDISSNPYDNRLGFSVYISPQLTAALEPKTYEYDFEVVLDGHTFYKKLIITITEPIVDINIPLSYTYPALSQKFHIERPVYVSVNGTNINSGDGIGMTYNIEFTNKPNYEGFKVISRIYPDNRNLKSITIDGIIRYNDTLSTQPLVITAKFTINNKIYYKDINIFPMFNGTIKGLENEIDVSWAKNHVHGSFDVYMVSGTNSPIFNLSCYAYNDKTNFDKSLTNSLNNPKTYYLFFGMNTMSSQGSYLTSTSTFYSGNKLTVRCSSDTIVSIGNPLEYVDNFYPYTENKDILPYTGINIEWTLTKAGSSATPPPDFKTKLKIPIKFIYVGKVYEDYIIFNIS